MSHYPHYNDTLSSSQVLKEYILRGGNFVMDVCRPGGDVYLNEVAGVNDILQGVEELVLAVEEE